MEFDYNTILKYLPHRYPFLFVDGVTEVEIFKSIAGYKNVSFNEQFFQGHFPDQPVFPGVLMLEAMAQIMALLCLYSLDVSGSETTNGGIAYLARVEGCRFRNPVYPGSRLELSASITKIRSKMAYASCSARVGELHCCSADIACMLK